MKPYDNNIKGQSEASLKIESLSMKIVAVVALLIAAGVAAGFVIRLVRDKPDPAFLLALGWVPVFYFAILLLAGVGLWSRQPWAYGTALQVFGLLAVISLLNSDIMALLLFLVLMAFLVIPRARG